MVTAYKVFRWVVNPNSLPRGTPVEHPKLRQMMQFVIDTYPKGTSNRKAFQRLGRDIAKTTGRNDPWSPSYTANAFYEGFAKGRSASPEFIRGLEALAAKVDGAKPPAFMLAARRSNVLSWVDNDLSGAFVMGAVKKCAFPGCSIMFVGTVPWRKYCPEHSAYKRPML